MDLTTAAEAVLKLLAAPPVPSVFKVSIVAAGGKGTGVAS
jgi:hypothetical protein